MSVCLFVCDKVFDTTVLQALKSFPHVYRLFFTVKEGWTKILQLCSSFFKSCQKVELGLSKLVIAIMCQGFVLALLLLLFCEWNYLIMS